MERLKLVAALVIAIAEPAFAVDVIVPRTGLPNGNTDLPFFYPTIRFQQIYGAPDFQSIGPGGGFINEIWFSSVGSDFAGNLTNIHISLSTTTKAVDGLSATFSDNVGADEAEVVGGSLFLSNHDAGGTFTTRISLDRPFPYNPSAGSLLLDIRDYHGLSQTPLPPTHALATFGSPTDQISVIWSFNVDAGVADHVSTGGLYTKFVVTPVPEPSTAALIALGACGFFALAFRRRLACILSKGGRS